ncbi:MAG: ATP-binding protein, partial [Myxococcota bacterium]|nr:ATP-binding protein [Myxococcota bacterium]
MQNSPGTSQQEDPFASGSVLLRSGLVTVEDHGGLAAQHTVHLHRDVVDFLVGKTLCDDEQLGFDVDEAPARLRAVLAGQLRRLSSERPLRAAIVGPASSGRLGIATQLARIVGSEAGLYHVPLHTHSQLGRLSEALDRARRFALLTGAVLVFTGVDALDDAQGIVERSHRFLEHHCIDCVWVSTRELPSQARIEPRNVLRLGYPHREQRLQVWDEVLAQHEHSVAAETLQRLAGGFLLSEGQIERAVLSALAKRNGSGGLTESELLDAARSQAQTGLGALASPEPCPFGLDKLVINEETQVLLQELVDYARHRDELLRRWGFGEVLEKGLGVTALFVGPPGTGKSLAATALARELGRELYRINLSQLVSKYIGETEKHLGSVFDAAEQGEVMLLFDEADSLFGKRTEVRTSVDRYANLEVNFLLQRIERFNGVVVLTTNHEKGIDDAFARRIRFRIVFEAPDERARLELWRALLP